LIIVGFTYVSCSFMDLPMYPVHLSHISIVEAVLPLLPSGLLDVRDVCVYIWKHLGSKLEAQRTAICSTEVFHSDGKLGIVAAG
jgi:hypothetical protein